MQNEKCVKDQKADGDSIEFSFEAGSLCQINVRPFPPERESAADEQISNKLISIH